MEMIEKAKKGGIMNIKEDYHIYHFNKFNKLIEEQKHTKESNNQLTDRQSQCDFDFEASISHISHISRRRCRYTAIKRSLRLHLSSRAPNGLPAQAP
jgi:hypothetical protein